ncbi:hypothetical protein EG68_06790 [Paragonimus skrjabini miyazakii]|uniref:Selenoprotein F n=1 Tax=Paragonimus skrjabini miyazakii TaxID=59628 RepID=A0A8S9Z863_9TREM|nr:hypothetical protein EG68_06790 [Paragonimus skrjabini miyazakii]
MLGLVRFFACYYLTCLVNVYGADRSSCQQVGFTSQLKCGSCNELKRFKLDKIEKDCFECCETEDAHRVIKKYSKADLVVLTFISSKERKKLTGLQLNYMKGARPTIRFFNEADVVEESHGIETWDNETIFEFLYERLEL